MKIMLIRETLWQSLVSDTFTFGCLVFAMWFSWGSRFWMAVAFAMFTVFFIAKGMLARTSLVFKDEHELMAWLVERSRDRLVKDSEEGP